MSRIALPVGASKTIIRIGQYANKDMWYRSLRSVYPFLYSSFFYQIPRNPMLCNGPDTPIVPLSVGASALPI